jgi:hypothetical protein
MWLASTLAMLAGVQLLSLGIIGEYMARVHHEVRNRPLYIAGRKIGFSSPFRSVPNVLDLLPTEGATRQERITAARLTRDWPDKLTLRDAGS